MCMHRDDGYREITDAFNPMRKALGDFHPHSKVGERAARLRRTNFISITLVHFRGPYQQVHSKKGLLCSGEGGFVIPWGLSLSIFSLAKP